MSYQDDQRLHETIEFVGLRAHATAVGFLQLSRELVAAGVLDDNAVDRIKDAIGRELALSRPRTLSKEEHARATRARLDRLFAGEEQLAKAGL